MTALEGISALVMAAVLANAAYQAGTARQERARVASDVRKALAAGVEYQATACGAGTVSIRVDAIVAALNAEGVRVGSPTSPGRWTVRYGGARAATARADPLREAGVRMRVELANASVLERGVARALGGWMDGATAMVAAARPPPGAMRMRRARLARGRTAAERAGGC